MSGALEIMTMLVVALMDCSAVMVMECLAVAAVGDLVGAVVCGLAAAAVGGLAVAAVGGLAAAAMGGLAVAAMDGLAVVAACGLAAAVMGALIAMMFANGADGGLLSLLLDRADGVVLMLSKAIASIIVLLIGIALCFIPVYVPGLDVRGNIGNSREWLGKNSGKVARLEVSRHRTDVLSTCYGNAAYSGTVSRQFKKGAPLPPAPSVGFSWRTPGNAQNAGKSWENPCEFSRSFSCAASHYYNNKNKTKERLNMKKTNNLVYCFKPVKSPYYYARFTGEDGKVRECTTKCKEYNPALRIGVAMALTAEALLKQLLPQHRLRAFNNALQHVVTGIPLNEPNVTQFLDSALEDSQLQKEPNTAQNRRSAVNLFKDFLKEEHPLLVTGAIEDIRDVQAKGYRAYIKADHEAGSVNDYLKVMTTLWNQAKNAGYTPYNPFVDIRLKDPEDQSDEAGVAKPTRRPLKRSEGISLVVAAGVEMTALIVSGLNIGGRNGDMSGQRIPERPADYDPDLPDVVFRNKKGKKKMDNAVLPEYEAFCQEYYRHLDDPNPGAVMFPSYGNHPPQSRTSLVGMDFGALCELVRLRDSATAFISKAGRRMYEINYHALRYTCNMAHKVSGMRTEVVSGMLGHSVCANRGYDKFQAKELQRADLYKAVGKEELLKKKALKKVEHCMNLYDILELTVYATEKLRCIRLELPLPEPPPLRAPEIKKAAQPGSEAAQPTSDNTAIQTGCPVVTVAQSAPLIKP